MLLSAADVALLSRISPALSRSFLTPLCALAQPLLPNRLRLQTPRRLFAMPPRSAKAPGATTDAPANGRRAAKAMPSQEPAKRASKRSAAAAAAASAAKDEAETLDESELSEQSEAEEALSKATAKGKKKPSSAATKAKKAKTESTSGDAPPHPCAPPADKALTEFFAPEHLPRNTSFPDPLTLTPKKEAGHSRIACFNIVSLKSALGKGLERYLDEEGADVVVLSETKVNEIPSFNPLLKSYPHQSWCISDKKGYAGVALLSKTKPLSVTKGLLVKEGGSEVEASSKGRVLTAEFEGSFVVGTYVVNAGEGLKFMETKQRFNDLLATHIARLDEKKPVVWCGDLNVVGDWRDLSKPREKWNKSPGYTEIECEWYRRFKEGTATQGAKPFVDVWREKHPDAIGHFSFAGHRGQQRSKGLGWRLDSFVVSERLAGKVRACEIRYECYGISDHLPVYADFEGEL